MSRCGVLALALALALALTLALTLALALAWLNLYTQLLTGCWLVLDSYRVIAQRRSYRSDDSWSQIMSDHRRRITTSTAGSGSA
jgi:hypothetical protein